MINSSWQYHIYSQDFISIFQYSHKLIMTQPKALSLKNIGVMSFTQLVRGWAMNHVEANLYPTVEAFNAYPLPPILRQHFFRYFNAYFSDRKFVSGMLPSNLCKKNLSFLFLLIACFQLSNDSRDVASSPLASALRQAGNRWRQMNSMGTI